MLKSRTPQNYFSTIYDGSHPGAIRPPPASPGVSPCLAPSPHPPTRHAPAYALHGPRQPRRPATCTLPPRAQPCTYSMQAP